MDIAHKSLDTNLPLFVNGIVKSLSNDLRLSRYRGNPNELAGHCYIVSEALYWLSARRLKPMFVRHEGEPHWFLKYGDDVIDITATQFKTPVPYDKAIGKGFLTNKPSKRCQILLDKVQSLS